MIVEEVANDPQVLTLQIGTCNKVPWECLNSLWTEATAVLQEYRLRIGLQYLRLNRLGGAQRSGPMGGTSYGFIAGETRVLNVLPTSMGVLCREI